MQVRLTTTWALKSPLSYEFTYGETGSVCANWMQYNLIKILGNHDQPSSLGRRIWPPLRTLQVKPKHLCYYHQWSLLVGEYDYMKDWKKWAGATMVKWQLAVYISPQGIVHGTFNTLLNAGAWSLGVADDRPTGANSSSLLVWAAWVELEESKIAKAGDRSWSEPISSWNSPFTRLD